MSDLLGQLREMQRKLEQAKEELGRETVEASSGRGGVRVVMSGTQECLEIRVKPDLLDPARGERLEELLALAVNQAIRDSQLMAARKLGPLAGPMAGMTRGA